MSSKAKSQKTTPEEFEKKVPLMQRPYFNMFYTFLVITLFSVGIILFILSYSVLSDVPSMLFVSLGVIGFAVILLTMRSSYKNTAPQAQEEEEEKKEDSGLRMRNR